MGEESGGQWRWKVVKSCLEISSPSFISPEALDLEGWIGLGRTLKDAKGLNKGNGPHRSEASLDPKINITGETWKMGNEEGFGITTGQPNLYKQDLSKLVSSGGRYGFRAIYLGVEYIFWNKVKITKAITWVNLFDIN